MEERDDLDEFGNEFSCKGHRTDFFFHTEMHN